MHPLVVHEEILSNKFTHKMKLKIESMTAKSIKQTIIALNYTEN